MATLSIELVPRSREALAADLQQVRARFPSVDTVNLPDLVRFPLRSWDACGIARAYLPRTIPHLRACDVDLAGDGRGGRLALPALKDRLAAHDLREVIVVQGDDAQGEGATTLQLIEALRAHDAGLVIHAALDPYRASPRRERDYAAEKRAAGADGFFTQPFFDLRVLEVWAELFEGESVTWGLSPILSPASRRYWERRNLAFLPADFRPTLEWNRAHAARTLRWARAQGASLYVMPIRADLEDWLGGLL